MTAEPRGILVAGSLVADIVARPVEEIRWDSTTWVEEVGQYVGGNGANTAYAAALSGAAVRLLGAVGRDSFGDFVLAELGRGGVETAFVRRVDSPTAASSVLVRSDGARAFLHRPGASREAFPGPIEFTPAVRAGCGFFHLANPFALPAHRPHAAETLRRAREARLIASVDAAWDAKGEWMEIIGPCLPLTEIFFANQDEARMLSGAAEPDRAAAFFLSQGARVVVLKLGAGGCAVYRRDFAFQRPAYAVTAVDTTGAGDCFAGAFLAELSSGAPLEQAARFANAVGAMCVRSVGAATGVRPRTETLEWIKTQPPRRMGVPDSADTLR